MNKKENFTISTDIGIMRPKKDHAYPIPCSEWEYLKKRIGNIQADFPIFLTIGSVFAGGALTTFLTIITGGIPSDQNGQTTIAIIIAWCAFGFCSFCGIVSFILSFLTRHRTKETAEDIKAHMTVIEERYVIEEGENKSGLENFIKAMKKVAETNSQKNNIANQVSEKTFPVELKEN